MRFGVLFIACGVALAQEVPAKHETAHEGSGREEAEKRSDIEADFAASSIFRSGSYIQPIARGFGFEGHYFSAEGEEVGLTGVSYSFQTHGLKLSPGIGVTFGNNHFATAPAITVRLDYEHKWFVAQSLNVWGMRQSPVYAEVGEGEEHGNSGEEDRPIGYIHPAISDGNHVSGRLKRLTIGGTWEHIHFREGDEWKGGGRLAFRLFDRVSAVLMVLGPGKAEWRGGVVIHPPQRD